jgi:uncharacterized protein (DUF1800 family)
MAHRDALRLADQTTFGATEALIEQIKTQGAAAWVDEQMTLNTATYTSGGGPDVHQNTQAASYCDLPAHAGPNCWRDHLSTQPLLWDFYRNALTQPDQLRQRVAFALSQVLVVSGVESEGTYGFRNYHNALLNQAFGNYRQLLKSVALSPVMGDFLNHVNNDKTSPNENFARELLQLFSIGTCELNLDGSLKGGRCQASYDNDTVRAYAYALTGWTYPAGGRTAWGCWPQGTNCRYYGGDMVAVEALRDNNARPLLSGINVAANDTTAVALERVLDSLMAHPNIAPFVAQRLISHLVSANPSPAYVERVASAFLRGSFSSAGASFGKGQRGDMAATVAAVLLDAEARGASVTRNAGKLREPALAFTGVLRALNGNTDGEALGWWWGGTLQQQVFRPPSVFNFYAADHPLVGTNLQGPAFGLHNANAALQRMNYLMYLLGYGGSGPDASVPRAVGTKVNLSAFTTDAADAAKLVDRLSMLAFGSTFSGTSRSEVLKAVGMFTEANDAEWQISRVRTAAYLVFASPHYQVQR